MKNVSTLKSNRTESPKTPGGISRSLLTPCRRIGLSRNWKKVWPSPFISPLTGSNSNDVEEKIEKRESRKRKIPIKEVENEETSADDHPTSVENKSEISVPSSSHNDRIHTTPSRCIEKPRKKMSKTLITARNYKENTAVKETEVPQNDSATNKLKDNVNITVSSDVDEPSVIDNEVKVTSVREKTKGKSKTSTIPVKSPKTTAICTVQNEHILEGDLETSKRSPKELTKACMVVIQKKIFKTDIKTSEKIVKKGSLSNEKCKKVVSQTLFDSDSDEVPLCQINKKEDETPKIESEIRNLDDDFIVNNETKVKKLVDKNTSMGGFKPDKKTNNKVVRAKQSAPAHVETSKPSSQSSNSVDDDDDFEIDSKRTILIRKTYDKVSRPLKAKSTGSITQKDIDELKARIEKKKKILLARATTEDTKDLRGLIKKWQKGCQEALMELMELMKTKFSDGQNMDYSEMLKMLKIPAPLVGYDSDNDCFNTPEDADIILSKFNNL